MGRAAERGRPVAETAWDVCDSGLQPQQLKRRESAVMDGPETEIERLTPAAIRMRLYRDRRRKNLRCVAIELRETEIDWLIRRGLLNREKRNDPVALKHALYAFFDHTLS
jgi:hypothetical protein